jgi:hypothetical protein
MTRQMAMVGFLQAQNCTNLPSSWRHPESRDDSMSADYYQEIAGVLEAGKFHMAFFDDRLAMPGRYGNDHAHTVEYGIRCVKMDPVIVLTTHPGCEYRQDRARYRGLRECAERRPRATAQCHDYRSSRRHCRARGAAPFAGGVQHPSVRHGRWAHVLRSRLHRCVSPGGVGSRV